MSWDELIGPSGADWRYPDEDMSANEPSQASGRSFGRTVVAVLIFLVAAWLLFGFVIHILSFLFSTLIFILAVVAVIWALKVLL